MPGDTAISWTNRTWNPATGCAVTSPGCAHCYAESTAERFRGVPGSPYEQGFDLRLWPTRLGVPIRWTKPSMVFVNSMSDLFWEEIPTEFIAEVYASMAIAGHHTFQVLTKRPDRARALLGSAAFVAEVSDRIPSLAAAHCSKRRQAELAAADVVWPLANVWQGVTIENRAFVGRADVLRDTPAALRFVSAEPLLGPLVPDGWREDRKVGWADGKAMRALDLSGIDWLIAGGESGAKARPMRAGWARDLRAACEAAGTAFFFKQAGSRLARELGMSRKGALLTELPADYADLRVQEFPTPTSRPVAA